VRWRRRSTSQDNRPIVLQAHLAALAFLAAPGPHLFDLRVANGATPFAGDGPLETTVSPNGDGFRDTARVSFRLDRPVTLRVEAIRTDTVRLGRPSAQIVWRTERRYGAGRHLVVWKPAPGTVPRTYVLRMTATGRDGSRTLLGFHHPYERQTAPVVRVQAFQAGFTKRSYAPGEAAELRVSTDAKSLRVQVFAYGNQFRPTERDLRTSGQAMTTVLRLDWRRNHSTPTLLQVLRTGPWPSGLYFMRLTAGDGRVGYAPFIVRPRQLGANRVAVVLATNTWQAYNFEDADGNGWGDSWYVDNGITSVRLDRPFLDFGVPFRFRDWDLTFIAWLNSQGRQVDFLSDDDLDAVAGGAALARAYDLIVFPGHEEYVTRHMFDVVRRYRDLGGNLLFLAADNFFARVERRGNRLRRIGLWRKLGLPEASLVGAQYVGSNHGGRQAGFVVQGAALEPWVFAGTGLTDGSVFGSFGIEIDARGDSSPDGTEVLARIPDLAGPGRSAEMTYYRTRAGAKVFAAGALNFAAAIDQPAVSRLVANVLAELSRP
jgi:hypothetical protein